jgi:hypothetical protein
MENRQFGEIPHVREDEYTDWPELHRFAGRVIPVQNGPALDALSSGLATSTIIDFLNGAEG